MGGPAGGEVASSLAVESFLAVARQEMESRRGGQNGLAAQAMGRAAAAANRAVWARASYDTQFRGMGTTMVAARLEGAELTVLNVGDSRAYIVRGRTARQITDDHSYVAEQVRRGLMTEVEAERSPMQSVITRAIGIEDDVKPDISTMTMERGDVLLLCTDGLTRHVSGEQLGEVVGRLGGGTPLGAISDELIAMANARGGSDNITCVLMRAPVP
jgi:protein phosphatase